MRRRGLCLSLLLIVLLQVNHQQVSTFLTAGGIKFMLLHGGRSEDSIRNFFQDVYELYVKVCTFRWPVPRSVDPSHVLL